MRAKNINSVFPQEDTLYSDLYDEDEREVEFTNVNTYQKHYYPDEHSGICVVRRKGESDEDLLKRFRKKYSKSGLAKELRDRMYYEKPSQKRRRKKMQSIRLIQREAQKMEEMQERYEKIKAKRAKQNSKRKRKEV